MVWILQNISKKESILLGLLGISLTTVSATLLYEFYRKENDNIYGQKRKSSQFISVELKVPNSTVAAVIGKGGYTIREIETKTDVTIKLQQFNHSTKSNSQDRICTISGPAEGVKLAKIIIQNIIDTVPVIDSYEFYVSYRSVKHILGRRRENLLKIQKISNAKIIMDDTDLNFKYVSHPANYSYGDPSQDGKKRIMVYGTVEQIEVALRLIEEKVRLEDGPNAALQDLCPIRVPGAYSKLLTDELPDDLILSKIMLSPLPADDAMEVYVSAMVTPGQFWIQILGPGIIYLESLSNEMSILYNNRENQKKLALKKINVGDVVAARCDYYDKWYRGEVTQILHNNVQYEIFLLDSGNFIECTRENILELRTDMLSLRLQAVECTLANVKPRNGEWDSEACKQFAACTWLGQTKVMDVTVKGYINRSVNNKPQRKSAVILCVEVYDRYEKLNVGQNLISEGFADYKEDTHSKMTDIVTNLMKRQFLSVRLLSKSKCLTTHAEEGEMNEDKSIPFQNVFSPTVPRPEETYEPAEVIATPVEKRQSNVAPEERQNDVAPEERQSDVVPEERQSDIAPETSNEVEKSTLNANKNDVKPDEFETENLFPNNKDKSDDLN